ncbi:MAG: cellulase family glycosylhydrolase, partial [Candidatus Nitrosocaldaceae archaeon]
TPNTNYYGVDSFTYQAYDGSNYSNIARVSININDINDAPIANDDYYSIDEDSILSLDILANDYDVDSNLTYKIVEQPKNGIIEDDRYIPNTNYYGVDSFTYQAYDGSNYSNIARVSININDVIDVRIFNVKDYGAIGNGVNDDTQAVRNAIEDANQYDSAIVYFPQGEYVVKEWSNYPNIILEGENAKIIRYFSNKIEMPISNITVIDFADAMQISDLRGIAVGYKDVLMLQKSGTAWSAKNQPPIDDVLSEIKSMGMNMIRAYIYWEGYYYDKTRFVQGLQGLTEAADRNGIAVLYDYMQQWHLSSYVKSGSSYGDGFPHECLAILGIQKDSELDTRQSYLNNRTPRDVFWSNFTENYSCTINGINKPIWEHIKDYTTVVVSITKDHPSTIGYDMLNEPFSNHVFTIDELNGLRSYYKEIALHIRSLTDKKIFFQQFLNYAENYNYGVYKNRGEALASLAPRYDNGALIENLGFTFTYYDGPNVTDRAWHKAYLDDFKKYIEPLGIPIFVSEWNTAKSAFPDNYPFTTQECINYMQYWKNSGWGWSYWSYNPTDHGIKDAKYKDFINTRENKSQKQILIDAINQIY